MIPVYCVHYSPLKDRRKYIESSPVGGFCNFVTTNQEEEKHALYKMYDPCPDLWAQRCKGLYKEIPPYREMKIGDLGCSFNHLKCLIRISSRNFNYSLVIEDDAIFTENFWQAVEETLEYMDLKECDIGIIGGAFDHTISPTVSEYTTNSKNRIIHKGSPSTNTVCGYIITSSAAKQLLNVIIDNKIVLPIDFEYNYWFRELEFDVVHYVPYPIVEGSSRGFYKGNQIR